MRFKKSSAEIVARFAGALPRSSLIEQKKMFGYPSAFVHGNYFAGLYEENVVLRLPEPLRDKLPTLAPATVFDPMGTGRGMKDWLVIPAKIASSPQWLAALLESALPLVASLPPKMKKPARRAKPRVVR
jgi:TfoX/Sxy family transcriptional regulator of competence genes